MYRKWRCYILLVALLLPEAVTAEVLRIAATPDVIADYHRFVGPRRPVEITSYQGESARRDVVELLLVQQALALGGDSRVVELMPVPTYRRMLAMVANGHADVTGSSVWASDIDAQGSRLQPSRPLIADGQFVAGIYYAVNAPGADQKIRTQRWRELTAVSSRDWTPDWVALQRLGLAEVYDTAEWPAMVRMVGAGRADFLLAPFQADGTSGKGAAIRVDGVTLVPASGVCIALRGSRHIAVTRSVGGSRTLAALERGLTQLQRHDTVRRAYADAGFLSTDHPACLLLPDH